MSWLKEFMFLSGLLLVITLPCDGLYLLFKKGKRKGFLFDERNDGSYQIVQLLFTFQF